MNVGQILETHLGWASAGLAKNIKEIVNSTSLDISSKANGCKKILKKVFSPKYFEERINQLSDKEVIRAFIN